METTINDLLDDMERDIQATEQYRTEGKYEVSGIRLIYACAKREAIYIVRRHLRPSGEQEARLAELLLRLTALQSPNNSVWSS